MVFILLLQGVMTLALFRVEHQLKKLRMSNEELAQALSDLSDQLTKALNEIIAEIQGLDNVPQAVIDKLNAAKNVAQQLDDLNPDVPPPGP